MSCQTAEVAEFAIEDCLPIHINTLVPEQCIGIELYIRDSRSGRLRLYRGENIIIKEADRQRLIDHDVRMLFIKKADHRRYQDYLNEHLELVLKDETKSVAARFTTLNEVVRDVMATSFRSGDVESTVKQSQQLADHCVDLLSRDDYAANELLGVLHHDYQTFTHSANVTFLCVLLSKALGITHPDDIQQIAIGALLHDLGKLDIPERILTKPGKLTDAEFDVVRNHPKWGFQKLCQRDDITNAQLMMVYQHHERVDGGGYPVGIPKAEIHDWARLTTVVDVYEALTANRPYRGPLRHSQAIEIMERDCGRVFDPEMMQCWLRLIKHN